MLVLVAVVLGPPAVMLVLRRHLRWFPGVALATVAFALLLTLPSRDYNAPVFVTSSDGLQLTAGLLWAGYAVMSLLGALAVPRPKRRVPIELAFAQSLSSARNAK